MPKKIQDFEMVGKVFGRLTIIKRSGISDMWECCCSCGKNSEVLVKRGKLLRSGQSQSCGCLKNEKSSERLILLNSQKISHNMTNTKEYIAWRNMKARCDDTNHPAYENYGGRGISYTTEWSDFEKFFYDMGFCPKGYSLDREDVSLNYTACNCNWVSMKVQAQHKRKPKHGKTSSFKGVSFDTYMGKYKGSLKYGGVYYHLGYHESALVLAERYDKLLVELSGDIEGTNKALGLMNVMS